jgi:PmbA protein
MLDSVPTGHNYCQPYFLQVPPGEVALNDLIASVDCGIYICDLIGFGQSNLLNGDFSCNVGLGFLIEKGRITGRVKNVMAAGNIYTILNNGLTISSDVHPTGGMPYVLVNGINFAAAK